MNTNTKDTNSDKEMTEWRAIRKYIESLRFWSPLESYYFNQCTNGSDEDFAKSCINDCQNEVHRLIDSLLTEARSEAVRETLLTLRSILLRNPETSELYKFLLEMIDSSLYEIEIETKQKGQGTNE